MLQLKLPYIYRCCFVLSCLAIHTLLPAQIITTIAGNGSNIASGDGASASNAGTPSPYGVCINSSGDVFFTGSSGVRKIEKATGNVTLLTGGFIFPYGLCTDAKDNIYVSDYSTHTVHRIDASTNLVTTIAGNGTPGFGGDGSPAGQSSLNEPKGICTDSKGNLYISDCVNSRIRKVDAATGIITTMAGNGSTVHSGDGGPASLAGVPYPVSVCADVFDNIYFVEVYSSNTCRVRKIDSKTGIVTTVAGYNSYGYSGDGGLAVNASLFDPTSVATDKDGNIYIAEYDDSRVRKIEAASGIITTLGGTGENGYNGDCIPSAGAQLNRPISLCVDGFGNVYIADTYNNRIRKIVQSAGNGTPSVTITANSLDACKHGNLTFTATVSDAGANSRLQWKKNNAPVGNGTPVYTDGFFPGDVVTCTLFPDNPCATGAVLSNSITLGGVNNGQPAVTITADRTTVCPGSSAMFVATNVNNSAEATYHWMINGAAVSTTSDTFFLSPALGSTKVNCIIEAPACGGNWASISNDITLSSYSSIVPSVSISTSSQNSCEGSEVVFTAAAKDAGLHPTYQWKINGNNAGDGLQQFSTQTLKNSDQVSCVLTADATENCYVPSVVSSNEIRVVVSPKPGDIHFHILPPAGDICEGKSVLFTADQNLPGEGNFTWQINDSDQQSYPSYHSFTTAVLKDGDRVRCVYRSRNGCVPQWISDSVTVIVKPSPLITLTPKDTAVTGGSQLQLSASVQGDVSSYLWLPANKLTSAQTLTPLTVPVTSTTVYSLQATGSNGCEATASVKIKVIYNLHMPSGFTPNGDGINDVFRIPPPAELTLFYFSVYDRWGRTVFTTKDPLLGWNGNYQNHPLESGTYIYVIKAKNELGDIFQSGTVLLIR